jgi:hypothetical protein
VLDDHAGRGALRVELGDALIGGVGVVEVVVGELLALRLLGGGNAKARARRAVERCALMRVFTITQRLGKLAAEGAVVRRLVAKGVGEPVRDRGVIGRGAGIGFGSPLLA